jgi:hypothetical protein
MKKEFLTEADIAQLRELKTWDNNGQHFTATHSIEWITRMEFGNYIIVDRPNRVGENNGHGIRGHLEEWTVELTELGRLTIMK